MTFGGRICWLALLCALTNPPARALINMNEGKDLILVSGTYGIGYDSNVFTRSAAVSSTTQTASLAMDYSRQAGLIAVLIDASLFAGRFESLQSQDFFDPSLAVTLRKRHGRTTGSLVLSGRRESQPDPDAGARTRSWNYLSTADLRYPINDRYYLTNMVRGSRRDYAAHSGFTDLDTFTESVNINYKYTSKLDLSGGYVLTVSDTSRDSRAYDHSFVLGASGVILPKLTGTLRFGVQRRNSVSSSAGHESFNAFTSGTTLKWTPTRKLTFNLDLNEDFSTTSTDISVNRATAGLHGTISIGSRLVTTAGVSYTKSDYLGEAGGGRQDDLSQADLGLGVMITRRIRTNLSYSYMLNASNSPLADFERHNISLSVAASF